MSASHKRLEVYFVKCSSSFWIERSEFQARLRFGRKQPNCTKNTLKLSNTATTTTVPLVMSSSLIGLENVGQVFCLCDLKHRMSNVVESVQMSVWHLHPSLQRLTE